MKAKIERQNTTHKIIEWIEHGIYQQEKTCLKTGKVTHRSRGISSYEAYTLKEMMEERNKELSDED